MLIDAHLHFWRYRPRELPAELDAHEALRRDFLPEELEPELALHALDGVVASAAVRGRSATRWLLEQCAPSPFLRGVVGWLDLTGDELDSELDLFGAHPCFRGVRLALDAEDGSARLESEALSRGLARLSRRRLACDLRVPPELHPAAAALARRHSALTIVLDRPRLPASGRRAALSAWGSSLAPLADAPNVACKLAGWSAEKAWRAALELTLGLFGPARLCLASDWPACRLGTADYGANLRIAQDLAEALSPAERAGVLGGNAIRLYRLTP